jgi:putative membrane protein
LYAGDRGNTGQPLCRIEAAIDNRGVNVAVRIAFAIGVAVAIFLVAREGAAILTLLSRAGWMLLWLGPLQVLPLFLDVLGWRTLIVGPTRLPTLLSIALVRQAINRLLPVANVGGEIVGIRLLAQHGIDGAAAAASVIVELVLSLLAQYMFVAVGAVCLLTRIDNAPVLHALVLGLTVSLPPIALAIIVLRHGRLFVRIEELATRLLDRWLDGRRGLDHGARLDARIDEIFSARNRPLAACVWQLSGLIVGCTETWFALRVLGRPVSFADAVALESLTQAARSVFFMVPAGLGVQEAGLIGVGHLLGLGADAALALSLAKRMREVLLGLPSLVGWQLMEWRASLRLDPRR